MSHPPHTVRSALTWSFGGGIGAGALLFAQNIAAGRLLGPAEYGTLAYVQAIAMVLLVLFLAGFDMSASRALSRAESDRARAGIAATALVAVGVCSLVAGSMVVAASSYLSEVLQTSRSLIVHAAVFTALLAQRWLMERQLSGLGRFSQQAAVRFGEAITTIIAFSALVTFGEVDTWRSLVYAYMAGTVVYVVAGNLVRGIHLRPSDVARAWLRRLVVYGTLMNLSYIFATILFQLDKFAVQGLLGARELGIYTAYYTATIFVVLQLLMVISNVLYPAMARLEDKREVLQRIDRIALIALPTCACALLAVLVVVLQLFGSSYPFQLVLALLFCGWAALYACNGTWAIMVNAHGKRACLRELAFQPVRIVFLAAWFVALDRTDLGVTLERAVTGLLVCEVLETINLRAVLRTHVIGRPMSSSEGVPLEMTAP